MWCGQRGAVTNIWSYAVRDETKQQNNEGGENEDSSLESLYQMRENPLPYPIKTCLKKSIDGAMKTSVGSRFHRFITHFKGPLAD